MPIVIRTMRATLAVATAALFAALSPSPRPAPSPCRSPARSLQGQRSLYRTGELHLQWKMCRAPRCPPRLIKAPSVSLARRPTGAERNFEGSMRRAYERMTPRQRRRAAVLTKHLFALRPYVPGYRLHRIRAPRHVRPLHRRPQHRPVVKYFRNPTKEAQLRTAVSAVCRVLRSRQLPHDLRPACSKLGF
jgi:hypothetical protein